MNAAEQEVDGPGGATEPAYPKRLPRHFLQAKRYYEEVLQKDEDWLKEHLGGYVAIIGNEVVDSDKDFSKLAPRVWKKYGYGPIFIPRVTRGPRVEYIGPRPASVE